MKIDYTWLIVGIVLGMFVLPSVLAAVKSKTGATKKS